MTTARKPCGLSSTSPHVPRFSSQEVASWKFKGSASPPCRTGDILAKSPTSAPAETQTTAAQPSMKEAALVDALQASQAANDALEAVIKMQAQAVEKTLLENKQLRQLIQEMQSSWPVKPKMKHTSTEILAGDIEFLSASAAVQTSFQDCKEVPQASPRIHPPVVPPTPRRQSQDQVPPLGSPRVQPVQVPPPNAGIQTDGVEGIQQTTTEASAHLNINNASPYVAEAFRLGWLAGVKSNSMAANRSPSSTRSDESPPSDPGSYIIPSDASDSTRSGSGCDSPPLGEALPRAPPPALLPPPPPPVLLAPPAQSAKLELDHLEQLG